MGKELAVRNDELLQVFNNRVGKLLTMETVKKYLCPTASEEELFLFISLCKGNLLNPFQRDAYLVKYKADAPASMVVSKDAYFKRADSFPQYDGLKSGIIAMLGTKREYREGCMVFKGELLVGGWAEVYRKDRKIPFRAEVSMTEYEGKKWNWKTKSFEVNSMWKNKPATMITKVAEVQALRKAFPQLMGMYIAEEMEIGEETLPNAPINLEEIKNPKQTIIDVQPEETKKEETDDSGNPFKEEEKVQEEKTTNAPTDFRMKQINSLIASLPVEAEERDDFLKILQEKVGIPAEKEIKDLTQDEAVKLVDILKKQVSEIGQAGQDEAPAKEPPTEEPPEGEEPKPKAKATAKKPPAKKKASGGGNVCSEEGCGKYVSKKVADYSKKNLGRIVCFDCQQKLKGGE